MRILKLHVKSDLIWWNNSIRIKCAKKFNWSVLFLLRYRLSVYNSSIFLPERSREKLITLRFGTTSFLCFPLFSFSGNLSHTRKTQCENMRLPNHRNHVNWGIQEIWESSSLQVLFLRDYFSIITITVVSNAIRNCRHFSSFPVKLSCDLIPLQED